jgi:hypothetical protein
MTKPDLNHAFVLAAGPEAAARVFAYAVTGIAAVAPSLLTTASIYDTVAMRSRRVYSQSPAIYGTGNFKRVDPNIYYDTVIVGKRPFVSNTIEEFRAAFFDWEKVQALGFGANMNIPAVVDDGVIGTLNLLHRTGGYPPARVAAAMEWQGVVTLAFLLLCRQDARTATFHPAGELPAAVPQLEGL